ncbi:POU class 2 homeobox associating factor 3 [Ammospiza caudacuta]|uniref:POU class 2 homeobox associating factor 3 n=1 Tax=Ammospiza caudacuta TaxID=2857398 RepID=UPI00273A3C51|nr:POU class 2 homeobox associating factor 3 [Ammospiza caudacuta]
MPPAKAGGSGEGGEEGGRRHGTIGCCPPGASAGCQRRVPARHGAPRAPSGAAAGLAHPAGGAQGTPHIWVPAPRLWVPTPHLCAHPTSLCDHPAPLGAFSASVPTSHLWICKPSVVSVPGSSGTVQLPYRSVFPQILPGKPKVYQGVRVKITVKELLQQRRARQAATGSAEKVKSGGEGSHLGDLHKVPWDSSSSSSSIQFAEPVSPPHPEPFEVEPIPPVPSCCPPWQFSSCLSCEESPGYLEQLIDSCLQSDAPSEPAFSAFQPSPHYTPDTFQPVQLCFNQGLAASSPSSADLPSPWSSSCSPPQLSPLTPLTPSPPYSCPMEEWPCHPPCPLGSPACCCPACGAQGSDCLELLPPLAVAEDFFRRDRSWDICYS